MFSPSPLTAPVDFLVYALPDFSSVPITALKKKKKFRTHRISWYMLFHALSFI